MNITFVMEDFCLGGVENVTFRLIMGLRKIAPNADISIVCLSNTGALTNKFYDNSKVYQLPKGNFIFKLKYFKKLVTDINSDVIIFTKGGLSIHGLFCSKKVKKFVVQHVPIYLPETNFAKNILRRIAASFLFRTLDKVICVSDGIKNDLLRKRIASPENILRIYNPVLDDSFSQNIDISKVEYDDYYICVGRLHFQKGYDQLLKVVTLYKNYNPDIKVVIIGDGPLRPWLKNEIKSLKLDSNIILHGSENNPFPYIKKAKALLLTSRWEGLPTVLVEALGLETQIVSFDCPHGPRELTQDGKFGFLVDFMDINSFSKAILEANIFPKPKLDVSEFKLSISSSRYYKLFMGE
ncbi:TPA: glycosyltransferase [Photobacterium damselae]